MRMIHRFGTIESTMLEAARFAASGAAEGTVIVAEEQTAGQGRLGRYWHSEKGSGLYLTEILRPNLPAESLPLVTLSLGLATAEAISAVSGAACDLRWPNDVLMGNKKCAGILAQHTDDFLLAGIGINVNQSVFPEHLVSIAVSLRIATGREHSREDLLAALLVSIDSHLEVLYRDGRESVLTAFTQASSYVSGRRVIVENGATGMRGITEGLDPQGFLKLRLDDGTRRLVVAGGVRPECS
ncbi:MAG: biotin--[acetyl-CoA-carboxylase] ligase [Bryobacteraceae bacterium]|nr:biotin--[acetyl-CoA-carboxylase] ligase [Bryobacteraceae bacterium]